LSVSVFVVLLLLMMIVVAVIGYCNVNDMLLHKSGPPYL